MTQSTSMKIDSNADVALTDEFSAGDEMFLELDEVVFKIHTKGYFEYDPLRKGLKLLHTDNDVYSFIEVAVKNGSINLWCWGKGGKEGWVVIVDGDFRMMEGRRQWYKRDIGQQKNGIGKSVKVESE
ncbi:hypothetical protein Tco_1375659 [Tanacetum coccineum]